MKKQKLTRVFSLMLAVLQVVLLAVFFTVSTSAAEMLEDSRADLAATFGDLKIYETYTIAYNDLKAGAIDAIAIDMTAGSYLIASDAK